MHRFGATTLGAAVAVAIVASAGLGSALAQDPVKLVEDRQAHMKQLGGAMKTMAAFVKEGSGTTDDVSKAATTIVNVGQKMDGLWQEGTAMGVGKSEALPKIWTERAKFDQLIEGMKVEGAKMVQVAASGDKAAIGKQLGAVGGSCKACHEAYRKPKD